MMPKRADRSIVENVFGSNVARRWRPCDKTSRIAFNWLRKRDVRAWFTIWRRCSWRTLFSDDIVFAIS